MRVGITAVTHHIILPEAFKRKKFSVPNFPDIRLEKNGSQINVIDEHLHFELGNSQVEDIKNSVCFYTNTGLEEKHLDYFVEVFSDFVITFIDALWLLKDNAISSDFVLYRIENGKSHFIRKFFINSNSHCEYSDTSFSKSEIEDAFEWFTLLVNQKNVSTDRKLNENEERIDDGIINLDKNYPYEKTNRFQRARRFISVARKQTVLHAKITYYISALESLLSSTEIELRMQVADRGSRILGTSYEERIRINNVISIAYSFRSKYIHGAVASQKSMNKSLKFLGSVEELSEEMDQILRKLIKLFLTDLEYVIHLHEKEFAEWINELLYK